MECLKTFITDDDGAVTVDWVVLTAAIVGLGVVVCVQIAGGALDQSAGIGNYLSASNVGVPAG